MDNIEKWLREAPQDEDISIAPSGGLHIPIEKLRPMLDEVNYSTRNYHWNLYKDGYADVSVAASIELEMSYLNSKGVLINRTFVGSCNFALQSILPLTDWNATAKSMCIKNAAAEAAKRFGRNLNVEAVPVQPEGIDVYKKIMPKSKPDIKIMKQYEAAIKNNDQAAITMLSNIYDIKTLDNATA